MRKFYILFASTLLILLFNACRPKSFEVDINLLQNEIYNPTITNLNLIESTMILYLDHSTCVIDANQNSPVFKAMKPQLALYSDTLCLIKGREFLYKPNTNKSPTSTDVYNTIDGINVDIPYTDIGGAIKKICSGNSQAVIITDFEYFDIENKPQDGFPYMSGAFRDWLVKGYSIYIISEPYQEKYKGKIYDKKLFYVIFTDDRLEAPISSNLLNEITDLLNVGACTLFKMTNSDINVDVPKSNMVNNNLDFEVNYFAKSELITVNDSWESIREYVMGLNEYNVPVSGTNPEPFIENLTFKDGENYTIHNIQIIASNITAQYLSVDTNAANELKLNYQNIGIGNMDISDAFTLDMKALSKNKLNVYLTDKIFSPGYLHDKTYGGNLIRIDFVISEVGLTPFDLTKFEWQSMWRSSSAICVSKSIDNAIRDVNVVPTNPERKIIHTVFVKTESF